MPKQPIQLVISDLDGTLLTDDKTISRANLKAISDLQAAGIRFVMASGRTHLTMRTYLEQAGVTEPAISSNGALIYDDITDKVIYRSAMRDVSAMALYSILSAQGADFLFYTPTGIYHPADSRRVAFFCDYNRMAIEQGSRPVALEPFESLFDAGRLREPVLKAFLHAEDRGFIDDVRRWIEAEPGLDCVQSMSDSLDIMPAGISKGQAARRLLDYYGIEPEALAVFGDHDNDVSMMAIAGLSFGMSNGSPLALAACAHVAPPNEADGVAVMIERYILNP